MRSIQVLFCVIVLALLTACSKTYETTLDNGLKIIIKEDHRSPVVVSQIWYKIGGMDEPNGITGVSHVLEHMMFKGTKKHGPGEFSRIIAEHGGRENAFTSRDYTAYFQTLEKSRLAIAMELEADRMQNLVLDEKELRKEVQVVMEERRLRTEDKPEGRVYEKFNATAYQKHPYGHPIIGWMRDLENLKLEDVRKWYENWYVPNNATLVVVGDVEPRDIIAMAKKYYGPIPRRPVSRVPLPVEPEQKTGRRVTVSAPAEVPYFVLGYHVPVHGKANSPWEPYALDVLAGILDGGESARFARDLVRAQRIATSVGAGYDSIARAPSMFIVNGVPASGRTVKELERAVLDQIERIRREPITAEELKRVKAQVSAQDVYQRDSLFYQAMEIGMLETSGLPWRMIDDYVGRIQSVTAAQVQQVAKTYLQPSNLTVAVLNPLPIDKAKGKRRARTGGRHGR